MGQLKNEYAPGEECPLYDHATILRHFRYERKGAGEVEKVYIVHGMEKTSKPNVCVSYAE